MKAEIEEEKNEPELDKKTKKKIKKTVLNILEKSNLYEMTEKKVREEATVELALDLSKLPYKAIVSREVESFLVKVQAQAQQKRDQQRQARAQNNDDED